MSLLRSALVVATSALLFANLAGCPQPEESDSAAAARDTGDGTSAATDPAAAPAAMEIAGTWAGTIDCTVTMTVEGQEPHVMSVQREFSMTYGTDGVPANLQVAAMSGGSAESIDITQVGSTTTWTSTMTINGRQIEMTQTATIREASYTSTRVHVVVDYTFNMSSPTLEQRGTGTQTYDSVVSGDSLTYSSLARYNITQSISAGGATHTTTHTQEIDCQGTFQRQ